MKKLNLLKERFDDWYYLFALELKRDNPDGIQIKEKILDFIEQELKKERDEIVEMVSKEFDRQSESCTKFGHEPVLYLPDTKRTIINTIKNRV